MFAASGSGELIARVQVQNICDKLGKKKEFWGLKLELVKNASEPRDNFDKD